MIYVRVGPQIIQETNTGYTSKKPYISLQNPILGMLHIINQKRGRVGVTEERKGERSGGQARRRGNHLAWLRDMHRIAISSQQNPITLLCIKLPKIVYSTS
jgi:hypothetical protein